MKPDYERRRATMVERDLAGRGIADARVLEAMSRVPREAFVHHDLRDVAYDDGPLPIEHQQTISQPFIVARMIEALGLRGGERVLDIGTGSGYAAAVLGRIAADVYTVERHGILVDLARQRFGELACHNIHVRQGDGTLGWAEHAPYDAILVSAASPEVPPALLAQLTSGGRLVIPIGDTLDAQQLVRITRMEDGEVVADELEPVRFVPLVGEAGWRSDHFSSGTPSDSDR